MGVESDRLVFDYLSRVGDLAQAALPAAQRMQLVAQLRQDIDRERGGADSPATVRRILGRIGSPDAVVEAATGSPGGTGASAAGGRGGADSAEPYREPPPGSYGPYAEQPRPKRAPGTDGPDRSDRADRADRRDGTQDRAKARARAKAAAKDAGDDAGAKGEEPGPQVPRPRRDRREEPDWWRTDPRGGRPRAGDELAGLPGMSGGVFIPFDDEDLDEDDDFPPRRRPRTVAALEEDEEEAYEEEPVPAARRGLAPRLRRAGRGWGSPVLLLAAALLVAGAAIGSLIPLGLGWLLAYLSRRLSRPQAKFAVLGIPAGAAAGLVVWVWGRDTGKWGTPVAQGQVGQAFQGAYPAAIRLAAVGTALYLLWRSRRTG
ncbi:hypothetical protein V2S66_26355 [Streptomyces sp. V4-01]|uniref:Integral membrane protein n=1 Tax=Actinacidiphila polyblastidii TaxID=3110430 RepID=A0ABU7PI26_9ACTN|nr:hypothetical protein [Streptomyces sp. V4-01]